MRIDRPAKKIGLKAKKRKMSEPAGSELTTIFLVLNESSPAEHGVRVGTVNLSPEDARMQELTWSRRR